MKNILLTIAGLISLNLSAQSNRVPFERNCFWDRVHKLKTMLDNYNIPYLKNDSHIIPIMIGDPNIARQVSQELLHDYGIYVQHIVPSKGYNWKWIWETSE